MALAVMPQTLPAFGGCPPAYLLSAVWSREQKTIFTKQYQFIIKCLHLSSLCDKHSDE